MSKNLFLKDPRDKSIETGRTVKLPKPGLPPLEYSNKTNAAPNTPGTLAPYKSQYADDINGVISNILNREKFSYDLDADAFYQQYADKYIQQGKLAMADTMGQAAALTGGYGNSYAQSVGQQAYNAQLDNLNDIGLGLYQTALDKYMREGDSLYDQLATLEALDDRDYQRYLDSYAQGRDTVEDDKWFLSNGYIKGADGKWYLRPTESKVETDTSNSETDTWKSTGTYDDNGNLIFINGEGKTQSYGTNFNPYTGDVNPDAQNGTFSNGYQPDNIGGHKLEHKTGDNGLPMYYMNRAIYTLNGKNYIWDDASNRYLEVNITD